MSEWRKVILSDIASFTTGKLNSNAAVENGKYPFFTCSPETLRIDNYAFEQEAILLAGNNAEGNFNIKYYNGKFNAYQRTYVFTAKDNCVLRFLFYSLKLCLDNFKRISQGTATKFLTAKILNSFELMLPNLKMQQQIASILSAIDDKIELNTAINENLESQAQALYNKFFSPKSNSTGTIKTLDMYCSIFTGKKNANAAIDNGSYKFFTCSPDALKIDSYIYDGNAIIISGNGAYTGRTRFYSGKFDLYQRTYACTILSELNPDYIYPLYWFVKFELSQKIMGGTRGSAIPYIVMNDLAKFEFVFNEDLFNQYMIMFKNITLAIQQNEFENEKLALLRDTLLPKLMNGEIDVSAVRI